MSEFHELESKIAQYVLRTGACSVERKDLESDKSSEPTAPQFGIDMKLQTAANALRVDVDLSVDDEHARYQTVMSGQWISEEDDAFSRTINDQDPLLEELMMTVLAPQVLSAAQAKVADLARMVDCPPVALAYNIYSDVRSSRPQSEGETTLGN